MNNEFSFFYLALGPEEIDQLTGSADRIAHKDVGEFLDGAVGIILTDLKGEGISAEVGDEIDWLDRPDDYVLRKIVVQRKDFQKAVDRAAERVKRLPPVDKSLRGKTVRILVP